MVVRAACSMQGEFADFEIDEESAAAKKKRRHLEFIRMSQKMTQRFFGPKVHDPSRVAKEAMLKVAREKHRRDVCNARLQDLEKELQIFSEEFGSRLHELRASMKDAIFTTPDLRALGGSLSPDGGKEEDMDCNGSDLEKTH